MSGPAQVRSTEAIDALQTALAKFQLRVQNALDVLDGELHRVADWVEHDRPAHWRNATRAAEDAVHEAKLQLERCLTFTAGDERPTCREQKAAVEQSKRRLDYCREKGEVVKRWQRSFRHESFEYDGRVGQLRRVLDNDVPKARALLLRILRRLEEYKLERPPEASVDSSVEAGGSTGIGGVMGGVRDADEASPWLQSSASPAPPTESDGSAEAQEHHPAPPEALDER